MQVQMIAQPSATLNLKLPGPIQVLTTIVRQGGVGSLWLGQTGTFIRETGGSAAWFASKEAVAGILLARRGNSSSLGEPSALKPWESAVSGAVAGAMYNIALFPADTVKSAIQTASELRPDAPRAGFFATGLQMYRAQGIKGLYAGCGVTIARSIPSSAIIFVTYDGLKRYFG
jgi:ornithine carrier protein